MLKNIFVWVKSNQIFYTIIFQFVLIKICYLFNLEDILVQS